VGHSPDKLVEHTAPEDKVAEQHANKPTSRNDTQPSPAASSSEQNSSCEGEWTIDEGASFVDAPVELYETLNSIRLQLERKADTSNLPVDFLLPSLKVILARPPTVSIWLTDFRHSSIRP